MCSLDSPEVIESLSVGTTPTTEKRAEAGFQHLEQPHAWLCRTLLSSLTVTGEEEHLQVRVPPEKLAEPCRRPLSIRGWREGAMMFLLLVGLWLGLFLSEECGVKITEYLA